jgi:hypothetical protein
MKGRDWLFGSLAAAAAAALVMPHNAHAEQRRFTSEPTDVNRSDVVVYVPVLMVKLGPKPSDDNPGVLASWTQMALNETNQKPDTSPGGHYRVLEMTEQRDPQRPDQPPRVLIVVEQQGTLPEGAPPPAIVLIDQPTRLETHETAEVFREADRTLYRAVLAPPRAALVPEGHRVYLNPGDRYEVQLLGGVRERVAGMRQTLPTFGGTPRQERDTGRRRR